MTLLTKDLAETVAALDRIVPSRTPDPLHSQILIRFSPSGLTLRAALPEIDLELTLATQGKAESAVLVPAHLLAGIVRSLPGEEVQIEIAPSGGLDISSGSFRTKLSTIAASEFPPSPDGRRETRELFAPELVRALAQVRYAAASEEYRGAFRGVELGQSHELLWAVATDGFRLALYQTRASGGEDFKILLPSSSADELVRILKEETGNVTLGIEQGGIVVEFSRGRVWLALMEGELPDWRRVIPGKFVGESRVSAEALREILRRMNILAEPENHRVDLVFEADRVVLSAEGNYGYAREELAALTQGELPLAISFNARFLEDSLKSIRSEAILKLSGSTSQAVIVPGQDQAYLAVVVPLRI